MTVAGLVAVAGLRAGVCFGKRCWFDDSCRIDGSC